MINNEEEPEVHVNLDVWFKNKRFFLEMKDQDDHSLLILNEETLAKLFKLSIKHVMAYLNGERTTEMIDKDVDDGVLEFNVSNKKKDCISYDSNTDMCLRYGTDDPICCDEKGTCEEYIKKEAKK